MKKTLLSEELRTWAKKQEALIWQVQKSLHGEEPRLLVHTVKLQEEVGELAEQVLARLDYQRRSKALAHGDTELGEEIADVIIVSLFLAQAVGIDIEEALKRKIKRMDGRH